MSMIILSSSAVSVYLVWDSVKIDRLDMIISSFLYFLVAEKMD